MASSLHIGPKRRLSRRNSDSTEASLEIGIDIPSHSTGGGGFRGIVKEEWVLFYRNYNEQKGWKDPGGGKTQAVGSVLDRPIPLHP